MKRIVLHFFVAILTFTIVVSIAGAILIRPNSRSSETASVESNAKSSEDSSAWQLLISFENRDLANLEEKSRIELQKAIDSLVGPRKNPFLTPKLISRMENARGELRYAVIEESPLTVIPGECGLRVSLFSLGGKHLGSSEFASGWRITLTGMKLRRLRNLGGHVLEVAIIAVINGRDVAKQYYAPIGEKMLLIRLEDSDGKLIRNIYGAPNHTIGLNQAGRSAADWERSLESNDRAEVLAALMWLGGIHWNPSLPLPDYIHEELSEARLADEVRKLETVKAAINRLRRSEDPWVRDAAKLAADVVYYR